MSRGPFIAALLGLSLFFSAGPARAQVYESVGIRAQGMGGAFVAVSDDAEATWWNPAGLAGGQFFSAILEYGTSQEPRVATDPGGAAFPSWRSSARGFTAAYPALGLSYYRLQVSQIQPFGATGASQTDRQDRGRTPVGSSSLLLQQFGATVGQSVGEHLVVGSTVRLLHGRLGTEAGTAADASLDRAATLGGNAQTHGDLDVGAIATLGTVRVGVAVKHVTQPSFESGADRVDLRRQARAGVSATAPESSAVGPVTLAFDLDLTRTSTATGDARHVAAGAEAWLARRRLGVRGGVAANTVGDARPSGSFGVSGAIRPGAYVDARITRGSDRSLTGWGFALRVTF